MIQRNDRTGSLRIDAARSTQGNLPTATQHSSRTTLIARYEQELAYYRADAPFLPVEKCAARCANLSALLRAALDTQTL
jgi:hypothetical protein